MGMGFEFGKRICKTLGRGHWGSVAAGALLSTVGYQILRSRDAKKLYTAATAAVLREKDTIMREVSSIKEDCEDIYADAKAENARRAGEIIAEAEGNSEEGFCEV